jgi:hypothetical protein
MTFGWSRLTGLVSRSAPPGLRTTTCRTRAIAEKSAPQKTTNREATSTRSASRRIAPAATKANVAAAWRRAVPALRSAAPEPQAMLVAMKATKRVEASATGLARTTRTTSAPKRRTTTGRSP